MKNSLKSKPVIFAIMLLILVGFPARATDKKSDAIDHLVTKLSATYGLWINGAYQPIELPQTASTEQLVSNVFQRVSFDKGRAKNHRIVETRQVKIPPMTNETYTAVLTETDLGQKIVLLKFERPGLGWWNRVYDAKENPPQKQTPPISDQKNHSEVFKPTLSLEEAIQVAKEYIKKNKITLADAYLDSVRLERRPAGQTKMYWAITWLPSEYVKGGQTFLRVYMDKTVGIFYGE